MRSNHRCSYSGESYVWTDEAEGDVCLFEYSILFLDRHPPDLVDRLLHPGPVEAKLDSVSWFAHASCLKDHPWAQTLLDLSNSVQLAALLDTIFRHSLELQASLFVISCCRGNHLRHLDS
jgi:hypothetical protein